MGNALRKIIQGKWRVEKVCSQRIIREGLLEQVILEQRPEWCQGGSVGTPGGRESLEKRTMSTESLRQVQAWSVGGSAIRPGWLDWIRRRETSKTCNGGKGQEHVMERSLILFWACRVLSSKRWPFKVSLAPMWRIDYKGTRKEEKCYGGFGEKWSDSGRTMVL